MVNLPKKEGKYQIGLNSNKKTVVVDVYWDNWLGGLATRIPSEEIPCSIRQAPGQWKRPWTTKS